MRKSPASNASAGGSPPPGASKDAGIPPPLCDSRYFDLEATAVDGTVIGSPMKKQRASVSGPGDDVIKDRLGLGLYGLTENLMAQINQELPRKMEGSQLSTAQTGPESLVQSEDGRLHDTRTELKPALVLKEEDETL